MTQMKVRNAITDTEPCKTVTPSDITVCIAVRLTDINPWVIERLRWLDENYEPAPKFLILDFGSPERHASEIRKACESISAEYHRIDDSGEFSLAAARNLAFERVKTDFVFFTDIDFIYERKFFGRLTDICNQFEIRRNPLRCFSMPACHASQKESLLYESLSVEDRDRLVSEWCLFGAYTEFGTSFEFIAPYSNNLLCHRNLFNMVGGYCNEFRGHGSEDFEFFIRLAISVSHLPMPKHPINDLYGPLNESFFEVKEYAGFRRLLELFAYPSESIGLKSFHLWHPRPDKGYWTARKDWDRGRFESIVSRYINAHEKLLDFDFLPRQKKALCLINDEKDWRIFLPLRIAGYHLSTCNINNPNHYAVLQHVQKREFDRIFVFDPLLNERYKLIYDLAQSMGIKLTVIEQKIFPDYTCQTMQSGNSAFIVGHQRSNKEILIEQLVLDGQIIPCGLGLSHYLFSWRSYAAGHLTFVQNSHNKKGVNPSNAMKMLSFHRKLRKLFRSPRQFFIDALMKRSL